MKCSLVERKPRNKETLDARSINLYTYIKHINYSQCKFTIPKLYAYLLIQVIFYLFYCQRTSQAYI